MANCRYGGCWRWRTTWTAIVPYALLASLQLVVGVLLDGSFLGELPLYVIGVVALVTAVIIKSKRLTFDGEYLTQRSLVHKSRLRLADVMTVSSPSNYRLLYVTMESPQDKLRLAILDYRGRDSLAAALIDRLPSQVCAPAALAILTGARDGMSVDAINRSKCRSE